MEIHEIIERISKILQISYEETYSMIISVLQSESVESEMLDFLGFEHIELISELLSKRNEF